MSALESLMEVVEAIYVRAQPEIDRIINTLTVVFPYKHKFIEIDKELS